MLFMFRVCHAFLSVGHLLGKGWPPCSLVCDDFLCFCLLDCIDS